jgi:hypothetical protein
MAILHRQNERLPLTGVQEYLLQERKCARALGLWAELCHRHRLRGHVLSTKSEPVEVEMRGIGPRANIFAQ